MSSSNKKYDVFISFRGEDTRTNFTSHLHSALCQANIRTYTDDILEKGDEVWPALSKAIENSHVAIVVFSENYASSKWCLEELVKILQCRKSQGQVVIPVFYEVDPSHIRNLIGSYGEAFAKHELVLGKNHDNESIQNKLSEWKAALTKAANISGCDSRSRDYKNDSQVIEKIVKDVTKTLDWKFPKELKVKGLVGIDRIYKDVALLLSKNKKSSLVKNVQAYGIWGMGGIGKTTIAKVVFSQHFPHYDSVCFLENVREESERLGLTSLRDKLLSELLKEENLKSSHVESTFIMRRLSNKKVFIVLDDVVSPHQLDNLCVDNFGVEWEEDLEPPNIKLIVTTRNKHSLRSIVEDKDIYEVKRRSFDESLELFSLHAFKQRHPKMGYDDLSKKAVDYAGGVPLALKVLGSNLYSKSTKFWDDELEKLKKYPYDSIQNVLQVSYDGLDSLQKEIFLDIAFFFKDEYKDFVERILNACDFFATSGIEVLEDKALITISNDKRIQMHDLLQEMSLNIVRQGIKNLGKRSRLKDIEEVSYVLEKKKGSDAIEGIKLDLSQIDNLCLNARAFNMMTNLRFLKLYVPSGKVSGKVVYTGALTKIKISDQLRYLEWNGYHWESLPKSFSAKMLVEIRMPHSHVTELWWGTKDLDKLERIDLSESKKLENLPDLSKAPKLKWVNLSGCENLCDLHPSILSLDTLETLILDRCKNLRRLKIDKHLRSLKKISVNGCTSLGEYSVSSDLMLSLDLSSAGIETLDSSIGRLSNLAWLSLEGSRLKNLPNELSFLRSLWGLRISNCKLVTDKLHILFDGLTQLTTLYLMDCHMPELPDNISGLAKLYKLRLDGSSVESLPASIMHLSMLRFLSLKNCNQLRCLPKLPPNIRKFKAVNCRLLQVVPTLKTFAANMRGMEIFISFENCMKLDRPSLYCIMKGAQLTMMSAVFENIFRDYDLTHGPPLFLSSYYSVEVCLPGSTVPGQFTYRSRESSITINLPPDSHLRGIILSVVLSPSPGIKKHGAKIYCQCHTANGTEVGYKTTWYRKAITTELNSDHVYIWYDTFLSNCIVISNEKQVCFKFYVTNDKEEHDVLNIRTKECGVRLIFDSEELRRTLRELYLELGTEFGLDVGFKMRSELGMNAMT